MSKRSGRTPMYKQIREYLMDQISQHIWKPHHQIPSENELSTQFNVSRITVKNALAALTEEGIVYRIQGKGSFVAENQAGEARIYSSPLKHGAFVAYLMPRLDNRFTANLLNGIENQLSVQGYHLLFCETGDSQENEIELLKKMVRFDVKGVIVYPAMGETYNEEILKLTLNEFPVVVVDRYLRGIETNYVCSDHANGAIEACRHLIELGHSRIGFVSSRPEGTTSIEDRLIGYEKALFEHGMLIDRHLRLIDLNGKRINTIYREGKGDAESKEQMKAFLRANPDLTAVLAVNSAVGLTFMEAAHELGVRVPADLSVVILDDYELSPFSAVPPTCVCQEEYQVGREAAKLLVSIIDNPGQKRRKIVVPTRLIVRESSGPARNG